MANAIRSRSRVWENIPVIMIEAATPIPVATRRKAAFSRACPRVGSARMATVNMADDGASSSSQKLKYRATTAAIHIRIAKAQEARGKPHGRKAPRSMTVKTSTHASWAADEIAALRINPAVPSLLDRRRQALAGFHRTWKDSKTVKIKSNPTFRRLRTVVSKHIAGRR